MNIAEAMRGGLKKVTHDFKREKMRAHGARERTVSQAYLDRLDNQEEEQQLKKAAYKVIEKAYMAASDNGNLPANVRQIYYAVRPLVLAATGKTWKKSVSFTQGVFQDYLSEHPCETSDWDIVYDARGHFEEPHIDKRIGCGTLEVRGYLNSWKDERDLDIGIDDIFPTKGPENRYKFALFIEKEGFGPLLERAGIAKRFDLAIFSSKGQPTTATRKLVECLTRVGVTILCVHDFDIAGISIAHWLGHSNKRFQFDCEPKVIDLGLRLDDVEELGLQSEEVIIQQRKDPTEKFFEHDEWDNCFDVTHEEADFLRGRQRYNGWIGQRVELNAMTSPQFVNLLEAKLREMKVTKVIPDAEILGQAWTRAVAIVKARRAVSEVTETERGAVAPKNLEKKVRAVLKKDPELSWDKAITEIAADEEEE